MTSPTASAFATAPGNEPGFVVSLDGFSGPLDLLLYLLREEKIEIADIPVARIADQFLQAIHTLGLNQAADYLEMAGRLVRLKVAMLLPRRPDEEGWEDPRHELVRRLLEYQQIREMASWLERRAERQALRFFRGYLPAPPDIPPPPLVIDLAELLRAVEKLISEIPQPVLHRVVPRPLDVEGATRRIEALLAEREEIAWLDALGPERTIADLLSTLIALLELARRGGLHLHQPAPFAPLVIRRDAPRPTD
jgi:segregation and condensation protein A